MTFERTKLNSEEKYAKVGIKILVSVLRKHACPNEEEEKKTLKIKMKSQIMNSLSPFAFVLKNGMMVHATLTPMA